MQLYVPVTYWDTIGFHTILSVSNIASTTLLYIEQFVGNIETYFNLNHTWHQDGADGWNPSSWKTWVSKTVNTVTADDPVTEKSQGISCDSINLFLSDMFRP